MWWITFRPAFRWEADFPSWNEPRVVVVCLPVLLGLASSASFWSFHLGKNSTSKNGL